VVGVNTAIYSPSGGNVGIGFAIPASTAQSVISQLKTLGRVERGWLGVQIQAVTETVATSLGLESKGGALIASLVPDGPAARAGLRAGDLILTAGGVAIEELKALPRLIAGTKAGTDLEIEVLRNGKRERIPVVIGLMPAQEKVAAAPDANPAADDARPRLGLYLAPLTPEARKAHRLDGEAQGVLIAEVESGSPAQEAGIRPGSLISMVGQRTVESPADVIDRVRDAVENDRESVLLLLEQNGAERFVAVPFKA
jgi:serine protease Do